MNDVRRTVALLAARIRAAHAARVWAPLAQAYRLLDVARALAAIHDAVAARPGMSRTRDTNPGAAAALDYDLSQRPDRHLRPYGRRRAVWITRQLAALAHSGLTALDEPTVRAMVRQAVRTAPPTGPPADPALAELRHAVDELAATTDQLGELMLEVAPPTCPTPRPPTSWPRCARISERTSTTASPPLRDIRRPPALPAPTCSSAIPDGTQPDSPGGEARCEDVRM
ncbi:hypothetical protein OG728_37260 [Streptomyces microflavus]|uniref:hypothetical protein n=1 Tax=Streptomyces TaxID=1883 RepID=UPI00211B10C2|nr:MULTISPECIES: hypothetical protein [Streptomyces]WSR95717.1 hypothetical protein OG728_37260 [Streptomyces microflavus]